MLNGIHLRQSFIRRRRLFFMLCLLTAGLSVGFGTIGSSVAFAYQADAAQPDADASAEHTKTARRGEVDNIRRLGSWRSLAPAGPQRTRRANAATVG